MIIEFESYPVGADRMRRITNFLERWLTGPRSRAKKRERGESAGIRPDYIYGKLAGGALQLEMAVYKKFAPIPASIEAPGV